MMLSWWTRSKYFLYSKSDQVVVCPHDITPFFRIRNVFSNFIRAPLVQLQRNLTSLQTSWNAKALQVQRICMLAFICIRGLEEPCWTERPRWVCSTFFRHKREYSSASQREKEFVLSRSEVGPAIWTESNFFWVCSNILWSECWWLKSLFFSFVPFLSFDQFCWMRSSSSKLSLSLISARDFCKWFVCLPLSPSHLTFSLNILVADFLSSHDRKKLFKEKKCLCPNNQGGKCHFGRFFGVRPIFRPKTTFRPNVKTPVSP